ncbi:hypothetical protein PsSCT_29830 [Pseudomonas sp. SCT]
MLCRIEELLPDMRFLVISRGNGTRFIASIEEIEIIGAEDKAATVVTLDDSINESSLEEIETALARFKVIDDWRAGRCDILSAIEQLNISRAYLFKLARRYDPEAGYASLLMHKRGRQAKEKRLCEAVEEIIQRSIDSECSGQPIPDSGLSFSSATAGGSPSLN